MTFIRRHVARRVALAVGGVAAAMATAGGVLVTFVVGDRDPEARALVIASGVAGVIACATAAVLAVRRILGEPLDELTRTIAEAEKGNFLVRARAGRDDEIGRLAAGFNRLLARITEMTASTIDRQILEARARELGLLYDVTRTITSELELGRVLDTAVRKIGSALALEEVAILLRDDAGLVVRAAYGFADPGAILGMLFNPGEGISGIVAASGEPLLIRDTSADSRYLHYKGRDLRDGSFVCLPIAHQGKVIGLLNALRARADAFSDDDIRLLSSLAACCGLAIGHAHAFDRARSLAVTDELTGLPNRRLFDERAESAFRGLDGAPLSLLLIDPDDFKPFNLRNGHARGDEVLAKIGALVRERIAAGDTLARFSGGKLAVLAPGRAGPDALALAESIRTAVESAPLAREPITVSIGVATAGDGAATPRDLLARADAAVVEAKGAGKNRVGNVSG